MFGTLRVVLAALVALSHLDLLFFGKNPGVVAVVMFYLLSGYIMTGLVRNYYSSADSLWSFYADRLMRIYPQYALFLVVGMALFLIIGPESNFFFEDISLVNTVNNVLIVPLNFYMFKEELGGLVFVPPAWSLGAELQFYALIPIILRREWRPQAILFTLIIFSSASLMESIGTDHYGYRLLPGILHIFLSGSLLYDYVQGEKRVGRYLLLLYGYSCLLFAVLTLTGMTNQNYVTEVFCGYALGMPLLYLLARVGRKRVDDALGNISYGMFLGHFAIIWTARHFGLFEPTSQIALYLLLTAAAGTLGFLLVERPVMKVRRRFRSSRAAQAAPASASPPSAPPDVVDSAGGK